MKFSKMIQNLLFTTGALACLATGAIGVAHADSQLLTITPDASVNTGQNNQPQPKSSTQNQPSKPAKKVIAQENLNGTTTTIPKKDIVNNYDYGFYYNMKPYPTQESTAHGNERVSFGHPVYLHYARHTKYRSGRVFGDPQSMTILPDGRTYVIFNVGHGDSLFNRILEYNVKNHRLLKVGPIFKAGHGQGLSYDYHTHKLVLCVNQFTPHQHGILKGDLMITRVGKQTLKPYGKVIHLKAPRKLNLGDDFTVDGKGNFYNVAKYGKFTPFSPYGGLLIYKNHRAHMKLSKLLFHSPSSTIQNIEYNPKTNRIYTVGNNCITSIPVRRLNHLRSKDLRVSIFNNPTEFESLAFYKKRAYLLLPRPSRILVSNKLF